MILGAGEVIAELKKEGRPSYLNHKFPAGDIPEPVRKLYLKEKIRVISDIDSSIPIEFNDASISVNLSGISLRGVSPIHVEYLGNMGVRASMSIPLIKDGELWGLIACHHSAPKALSPRERRLLIVFAEFIASHLDRVVEDQIQEYEFESQIIQIDILSKIKNTDDFVDAISDSSDKMLEFINADAFMLYTSQKVRLFGEEVEKEEVQTIVNWLDRTPIDSVMSIDDWPKTIDREDSMIGGILVLKLSPNSDDYLVWIRRPEVVTIKWGGNPYNTKTYNQDTGRLHPRKSFETWKEQVGSKSIPWRPLEIAIANEMRNTLRSYLYELYSQATTFNDDLQQAYSGMRKMSDEQIDEPNASIQNIEDSTMILEQDFEKVLDDYGIGIIDEINTQGDNVKRLFRDVVNVGGKPNDT